MPLLGTWATVGGVVGVTFDAYAVVPHRIQLGGSPSDEEQHDAQLDDETARDLRAALHADPQGHGCALWEGYGGLLGGGAVQISLPSGRQEPIPAAFAPEAIAAPRLELPHRRYLVFEAELGDLAPLHVTPGSVSRHVPNLFWPRSHEWLVGFDVDVHATFVGGTSTVIDAVLGRVAGARVTSPEVMLSVYPGW